MPETVAAEITVNGSTRALSPGDTVATVVADITGRPIGANGYAADGQRLGIAVALNAAVVPRLRWADTVLRAGDEIEIVTAAQGG